MSLRFMLDTELCLQLLRDRPAALRERFNAEADGLALSTIVLMELLSGAVSKPDPGAARRAVEDFASRFEVLAFDRRASEHAAEIQAAAGDGDGDGGLRSSDLLVAGHARSQGLTLVTNAPELFADIRGLAVDQWS